MNKIGIIVVGILVLHANVLFADTLEDILQQHSKTIGQIESWEKLKDLTYELDIKEPSFSLKGIYRVTRSGKMRIDIFAGGQHVFTEVFNGHIGWQWQQGDKNPEVIKSEPAAVLRHGIEMPGHVFSLMDMQKNGHQLSYIGEEQWQGMPVHLLELKLKDGHQKFYLLEQKSGVILANRDKRAFHPDIDNTEVMVETRLTDYREFRGMKRSFNTENWDLTNNQILGTTRVLELLMNSSLKDSLFEMKNFRVL